MSSFSEDEKYFLSQIPKPAPSRLVPKTVSSVLDRVLLERGYVAEQARELLVEKWSEAVGETLGHQSEVGNIRRGQLYIYASNEIVRSELEYEKTKALKYLQHHLPTMRITGIRIQLRTQRR